MLNARLTLKKNTKEAMNKSLGVIEKRKLRLKKLKELDESGYLSSATNRSDVGEMVGLPTKKRAYDWSTMEIKRGGLKETLVGFGNGGKPIYEYHYETNPVQKELPKNNRFSSKDMFYKLRELEKSGELAKAECRSDLIRLLGFKDKSIGYTCVVNWIRRGHLQETELERDASGRVIAKYKLTGSEPVWRKSDIVKKKSSKKTKQTLELPPMPVYDKKQIEEPVKIESMNKIEKVEIVKNGIIIKIDIINIDDFIKVISSI